MRFAQAYAAGPSKRSTRAGRVATTAGAAAVDPPPSSSVSQSASVPLAISHSSTAPRTTWTASTITSGRSRMGSVVRGHRLEQVRELLLRLGAARRHVLAGHVVRRRLVAGQDLPRDADAMDLVGAVIEARPAREAVHRLEGQVGGVAERAVDLQRPVDHVVQGGGAEELDQRDVLAR